MLTLNLSSLGVSEASLERAILAELGMTREQAVKALADKFGVSLAAPVTTIRDGARVATDKGDAVAQTLTADELATLRNAAQITSRLFATA